MHVLADAVEVRVYLAERELVHVSVLVWVRLWTPLSLPVRRYVSVKLRDVLNVGVKDITVRVKM